MEYLGNRPTPSGHRSRRGLLVLSLLALLSLIGSGCAAFSNPVNQGIPVDRLPPEYFAVPKADAKTIPLTLLVQDQPDVHRVDADDVLGVFIEGITGEKGTNPLVRFPDKDNSIPAAGFPYVVSEEGTLPLPNITPLKVKGMTISEVREAVIKAYVVDYKLIEQGKEPGTAAGQVLISLMRPRHIRVEVYRQEAGSAIGTVAVNTRRGTAAVVELRIYENDVGHALIDTGGLPGLDAINEVVIQRGRAPSGPTDKGTLQFVRIPIRLRPGEPVPFHPEDVVLKKGDIVFVESRDTEVYYAGGLLTPRQFSLPRDYDLTVKDAIAVGGGPLINNVSQNNLSGIILASGLGSASPSRVTVLRRTKNGGQIPIKVDLNLAMNDPRENIILQSGDFIILQESLGEAFSRYLSGVVQSTFSNTQATKNSIFNNSVHLP